jgi:hypothetical protein
MKGRPFTNSKDVIDGKERVQARCGERKMWIHPDLHEQLAAGELKGYDQNGDSAQWVGVEALPTTVMPEFVEETERPVGAEEEAADIHEESESARGPLSPWTEDDADQES